MLKPDSNKRALGLFARRARYMSALVLVGAVSSGYTSQAAEPVSFSRDVAPTLLKHCHACHGPTEPKGGYQVLSYTAATKPGESGSPSITAGKPEESELWAMVSSTDPDVRMPKEADALSPAQLAVIKAWITEGAKCDAADPGAALASIVPRNTQPPAPQVYRRAVPVLALAFNAEGRELAASGYHEVTIWQTNGSLARRIGNVAERTYSVAYSPDGSLLAVAGGTPGQLGEVKLFRPLDGTLVRELGPFADVAYRAVFNPAGNKLAVGGADRSIRVFDVASGKQEVLIEDHADWVVGLCWSSDGAKLASGSRDKTSKLFNAANGESLTTYSGQGEQIFSVAMSADNKLVLTAGADKKIHAWNPDDGAKKGEVAGFGREVFGIAIHQDKLFSCSADKTVQQHLVTGLKHVRTYSGHTDAVYAVAFHPATGQLASGSFSGEVRIWNAEDGSPIATFAASPGYAPPVAAASK